MHRRALLFGLAFWASAVGAEPGPVVDWLWNEPASLWDFGKYKMELRVWRARDQLSDRLKEATPQANLYSQVEYDSGSNRLRILVNVLAGSRNKLMVSKLPEGDAYELDSRDKLKTWCSDLVNYFKRDGGIDESGEVILSGTFVASSYGYQFAHEDYTVRDAPKNYLEQIDQIIEIVVSIQATSQGIGLDMTCSSPLRSSKIYFSDTWEPSRVKP